MSESFDLSVLIEEYRDEARQQLAVLDAALLSLEQDSALPDEESAALLRALHTLKGNSGMLGLSAVQEFVHAIEDVFKSAPAQWTQEALDSLFESSAALRRAVERAGAEDQEKAFQRLTELRPTLGAIASGGRGPEAPPTRMEAGATEVEIGGGGEVLRIPFEKLDELLNRVSELFSVGAALEDLVDRAGPPLEAAGVRRALEERVESLALATDTLRSTAMELRLVPIGRVFSRFPSLVRDLARQQEKQVKVVLEGEEVELDKSTTDVLAEPLLHLVRNAVDHGIEPPDEREAAGKPPEGTIALRASREGDQIHIEIEDDGAGLDREAIRKRGIDRDLIAPEDELSPEETDELIFTPGFSTRSETNTVSGRGIGLDVVKRSVARLRGTLKVEDVPAGGTRFVLRLPLTLAIVPVLFFESGGEVLALPATDVEETLRKVALEHLGAAEVVRHHEELIPLARPGRLFGWDDSDAAPEDEARRAPFVILLRRGSRSAAIPAERLLEQRSVVVKALPPPLGSPRGVSGATIMPGGRVVLLLDAGGVLDLNLDTHRRNSRAR